MKHLPNIIILLLCMGDFFCKESPPQPPERLPVNPYIKNLISPYPDVGYPFGNCSFGVFGEDSSTVYFIKSHYQTVYEGAIYRILDSSVYPTPISGLKMIVDGYFRYLDISPNCSLLVAVRTVSRSPFGNMWIIDLASLDQRIVNDSQMVRVSGAVFLPDSRRLIFYGSGVGLSEKPEGFYLYDLSTGRDSLIAQIQAQYYGFHVSPDGKKLIYGSIPGYRILDLTTGAIDSSSSIYGEWFRYSPSGRYLVYSSNSSYIRMPSKEVGLIDTQTGERKQLDVNANGDPFNFNFTPFLSWSKDGSELVFSQAYLSHDGGYPSFNGLYILKSF